MGFVDYTKSQKGCRTNFFSQWLSYFLFCDLCYSQEGIIGLEWIAVYRTQITMRVGGQQFSINTIDLRFCIIRMKLSDNALRRRNL